MKDLGQAKNILGMELIRNPGARELRISQTSYLSKVLDKFSMSGSKPVITPTAQHFKLSFEGVQIVKMKGTL